MTGKLPFKIALAITAFAIFLILTLTAQNQQPLFWDHALPRTVFFAGAAAMAAILGSMYLIWKKRPEESRRAVWIILCGGSFLLYDILIRTAAEIRIFETPLFPVSLFRFFEGSGMMLTPGSGGFNDLAGIALTAAGAMLLTLCAKEFCRNCRWKHLLIITGTAMIFQPVLTLMILSAFPVPPVTGLLFVLWLLIRSVRLPAGPAKAVFCALAGICALLTAVLIREMYLFVIIAFSAVFLYCFRKNRKIGIVPSVIFLTGGLLAALSLYAFGNIDVLASVSITGDWTKFIHWLKIMDGKDLLVVPLSLLLFASPLAVVTALAGMIRSKYRFYSTRLNMLTALTILFTLAAGFLCKASPFCGLWIVLLWVTVFLARILRAKDQLPMMQYITCLCGQCVLILIILVSAR